MKSPITIASLAGMMWMTAVVSAPAQTPQAQTPQAQAPQAQTQPAPARRAHHRARRSAESRFKRLDKNNDGRISRDEWRGQARAFDRLDRNHDGVLTPDELSQAARHKRRR